MENEELLPKPQTDLPLPEKEIPAHTGASKTNIFKSKFFLGFVAFSILIAFLIGGFYLGRNSVFKELNPSNPAIPPKDPDMYKGTPTPDPTADWKTYTNTTYGYTFSYPSKTYLPYSDPQKPGDYSVQYCPSQNLEDCAFPSDIFGVNVYDNPNKQSLDQWLKTSYDSKLFRECYIKDPRTTVENISFLGIQATEYNFIIDKSTTDGVCKNEIMEGGGQFRQMVFAKDNKIYNLDIRLASTEIFPELEQILSTFKFTN